MESMDLADLITMPIPVAEAVHIREKTADLPTYRARRPANNEAPQKMWLFFNTEDQECIVELPFEEYRRLIQAGQEYIKDILPAVNEGQKLRTEGQYARARAEWLLSQD